MRGSPSVLRCTMCAPDQKDVIRIPFTGAQLATALADRSVDPLKTQAAGAAGYPVGAVLHISLKYVAGATCDPLAVFNALQTAYGAGKITCDRDQIHPGMLDLTVNP